MWALMKKHFLLPPLPKPLPTIIPFGILPITNRYRPYCHYSTEFSRKKNFSLNIWLILLQNNQQFQYSFVIQELFLPNGIEENDVRHRLVFKIGYNTISQKALFLTSQVVLNLFLSLKTKLHKNIQIIFECLYQNMQGEIVWVCSQQPRFKGI